MGRYLGFHYTTFLIFAYIWKFLKLKNYILRMDTLFKITKEVSFYFKWKHFFSSDISLLSSQKIYNTFWKNNWLNRWINWWMHVPHLFILIHLNLQPGTRNIQELTFTEGQKQDKSVGHSSQYFKCVNWFHDSTILYFGILHLRIVESEWVHYFSNPLLHHREVIALPIL